jgi:tetratricopeptide (TPR) repeat protein
LYDPTLRRFEQGRQALRQGDHDLAIACFDEVIERQPRLAPAWHNRGLARLARQDDDGALADFTQALRLDPSDGDSAAGRARIHFRRQHYSQAITDFSEAIRLRSRAGLYVERGQVHAALNDWERAIADFDRAIALEPELAEAFHRRGLAYAARQDFDRARADLDEAVRRAPDLADAWLDRGRLHYRQKNYAQALADLEQACHRDPRHVRAIQALAWLWAVCPEAQFRDGHKALEYVGRAAALGFGGDAVTVSARRQHHVARRNDGQLGFGGDAVTVSARAAAHAELGDFDRAVHYQKQVLEQADRLSLEEIELAQRRLRRYEQRKPCRDE